MPLVFYVGGRLWQKEIAVSVTTLLHVLVTAQLVSACIVSFVVVRQKGERRLCGPTC